MASSAVLVKIVLTNIKFEFMLSAIFSLAKNALVLNET